MNKGTGFAAAFAVAVAAMRLAGPSSPTASAPSARPAAASLTRTARSHAGAKTKSAPTTDGGCVAYLPKEPENGTPTYPETSKKGEAVSVIDRFFSIGADGAMPPQRRVLSPSRETWQDPRIVIALTPDPRHTQLSLMFDREMVALQQAAQDESFVYTSSWMPWSTSDATSYPLLGDAQISQSLAEDRAACPGLLLFRHYAAPPFAEPLTGSQSFEHGLLVFIVGEQPTGGINQSQWRNAIGWIQTYYPEAAKNLSVIGPTFSGSLVSLDRELKRLPMDASSKLQILSGSVTSRPAIDWFLSQQNLPSIRNPATPHVDFGSFQENDELQIERFLTYWQAHGARRKETAILSEDETVYGGVGSTSTQPPCTPVVEGSDADPCYAQPLRLFYPRDLSALRSQYQKEAVFSDSLRPSDHTAHSILQDGAEPSDDTHESDTIPTYSGNVTPLAQEALLYGIVSELRSHHARFVLLRCTNPLDFLFLTRFLHRAYPEGRIVLVGADLLLRREIDTTEFRGVMGLTNYPLLPRDEHWSLLTKDTSDSINPHAHRVFESPNSEGTYLAARYSFAPEIIRTPSGPTSTLALTRKDALPGYADPFWLQPFDDHVPTWITVVGRDGFWPVAILDENFRLPPQHDLGPAAMRSTAVRLIPTCNMRFADNSFNLPLPWKIASLLVLALCLYQIYGIYPRQEPASTGLFSVFRPVKTPSQQVLLGISCSLTTAFLFEISILFQPLLVAHSSVADSATKLTIWITLILSLLVLLIFLVTLLWPSAEQRQRGPSFYVRLHGKAITYLVLTLASLFFWFSLLLKIRPHQATAIALFYRMGHITSGVSPLLPVVFLSLGFYLWIWQAMAGNLLIGPGRPLLPPVQVLQRNDPKAQGNRLYLFYRDAKRKLHVFGAWFLQLPLLQEDTSLPGLDPLHTRIGEPMGRRIVALSSPLSAPFAVWFLPFAITATVYRIYEKDFLTSLEGSAFTHAINFALLLALFLTLAEASRLFWTWVELSRLLQALSRLRLRRTFTRLHAIPQSSLWGVSGRVQVVQHAFFHQQWDAACRLQLQLGYGVGALDLAVGLGKQFQMDGLHRFDGGLTWSEPPNLPLFPSTPSIREAFNNTTAELLRRLLIPHWNREENSLALETGKAKSDAENSAIGMELSPVPAIRTAEEFVCLHYIAFIQTILARMRTMILSMVCLFIAVCFAISFYPFVPRTQISIWMMLNLAFIAFTVIYVYASMERDETLSYITNTPPGRLGGEFWLKTLAFLSGPVLGLLTTQFPAISDSILGWLQPGLDAFK